jgi:large subunit ribosomal protein L31e
MEENKIEQKKQKEIDNSNQEIKQEEKGQAKEEEAKSQEKETAPQQKTSKKESKPAVKKEKKKEKEEKIELEREYIIPLKMQVLKVPRYRRAKKAVKTIKEFLAKHMKVEDRDIKKVKINIYLNNEIWFRGIKKPANKIKVKAVKKGGIVYAELAEVPEIIKFKIQKEKRIKEQSEKQKVKMPVHEEKPQEEKTEEQKVDEKEKEKASVEAGLEMQKEAAKEMKHTAKAVTAKQEKQTIRRKAMKR